MRLAFVRCQFDEKVYDSAAQFPRKIIGQNISNSI